MQKKNKLRIIVFIYLIALITLPHTYKFLILNVLLAYIPFELSNIIEKVNYKWLFLLLGGLWLIFYPNTFYMITDFTHLSAIGLGLHMPFQYRHYVILSCGIFLGVSMGIMSAQSILKTYKRIYHKNGLFLELVYHLALSVLSSIAIYIGRFGRLHTTDLIMQPFQTLKKIMHLFDYDLWIFVLYFSILQFIILSLWSKSE